MACYANIGEEYWNLRLSKYTTQNTLLYMFMKKIIPWILTWA